jgi:hypothetical protein
MNEASDPRAWVKNAEEDYDLARFMKSVRAFARSLLGI